MLGLETTMREWEAYAPSGLRFDPKGPRTQIIGSLLKGF